ncbi:putative glycosylphosphatidylinositol-specific phospholipase C [Trypanosoma vivax]|uniref:Putative glycosylphosphatidylinositol-specific phospholipase C n=1 Tax=Trypanosoma vivax (strain Y486) TaxID=1055687 RepID=G0TS69_TRYVY|nr:putative glycosylphosphatidylinositol-specific phospholipase C [Trypanosoma vivax]CCC46794.1 putative glycosylphosphatidylinositol-specific phospholipase C [Trypanosoma vivax Y486]
MYSGDDVSVYSMAQKSTTGQWFPHSWMNDLSSYIGHLPITQIFLPGAHNAATSGIHKGSPLGLDAYGAGSDGKVKVITTPQVRNRSVSSKWAKCQDMTVLQLLQGGVRYLDLRISVGLEGDHRLYLTHYHTSITLLELLHQVRDFLNTPESVNEIIVLDFQHIYGVRDKGERLRFVRDLSTLEEFYITTEAPLTTTVKEIWRRSVKQRVFLVVKFEIPHPAARLRGGVIRSPWQDSMSLRRLVANLNEVLLVALEEEEATNKAPDKLFVTQAICTPTMGTVCCGAFCKYCGAPKSLKQVAQRVNSKLLEWFYALNVRGEVGKEKIELRHDVNVHGNILMLDFVDIGRCFSEDGQQMDAVGLCVYLNMSNESRYALNDEDTDMDGSTLGSDSG